MRKIHHPPNLVSRRLEEALQQGIEVYLQIKDARFSGVPVYLDEEFVEILYLHVPDHESEEETEAPYGRTVWLIKLSEIVAIAYSTEFWSKNRFEELLPQDQKQLIE